MCARVRAPPPHQVDRRLKSPIISHANKPFTIRSISEEDGYYIADIPDLEACSASGATPEEALREVLVGKELWLQTAREEGIALPVPTYEPELYRRRARQPRMVLTTKEAAAVLGVQPARVRHMILSGQLTAEKDGRDWWILRTDLEKAKDRPGVGYPKGRPRARATAAS